jgi:hypothetical protein
LTHRRRRAEQQRMADGEYRGVRADADRQRQGGGHREERVESKQAHRMPHIDPQIVEPDERPRIPMEIPGVLDTTEGASCGEPCVFTRQAPTRELVLQQHEMDVDLARKLRLRPAGTRDVQGAGGRIVSHATCHDPAALPACGSRTRHSSEAPSTGRCQNVH